MTLSGGGEGQIEEANKARPLPHWSAFPRGIDLPFPSLSLIALLCFAFPPPFFFYFHLIFPFYLIFLSFLYVFFTFVPVLFFSFSLPFSHFCPPFHCLRFALFSNSGGHRFAFAEHKMPKARRSLCPSDQKLLNSLTLMAFR